MTIRMVNVTRLFFKKKPLSFLDARETDHLNRNFSPITYDRRRRRDTTNRKLA